MVIQQHGHGYGVGGEEHEGSKRGGGKGAKIKVITARILEALYKIYISIRNGLGQKCANIKQGSRGTNNPRNSRRDVSKISEGKERNDTTSNEKVSQY